MTPPATSPTPVDVVAVYGSDDDGRRTGLCGVTLSASFAEELAKGKGTWGSKGHIVPRKAIAVGDGTVYLIEGNAPILLAEHRADVEAEEMRRRDEALAKLTESDKIVLGLVKSNG